MRQRELVSNGLLRANRNVFTTEYARRNDLRKHGRRMTVRLRGYKKIVSSRVAPQEFPVPAVMSGQFLFLRRNFYEIIYKTMVIPDKSIFSLRALLKIKI